MLQHIVHIGSGLELFQRILVFKDLADIAQQVEMVVADTGNAEHEVGFFITVFSRKLKNTSYSFGVSILGELMITRSCPWFPT